MQRIIQNGIKQIIPDFKIELKNFLKWFSYSFLIFWGFNRFNGDEIFGGLLYFLLKNPEPIFAFLIFPIFLWLGLKNKLKKQFPKIIGFYITFFMFTSLSFDSSVSDILYNEVGYPAASKVYDFFNMPPIDPYQIILFFMVFLIKAVFKNGLILLINYFQEKILIEISRYF